MTQVHWVFGASASGKRYFIDNVLSKKLEKPVLCIEDVPGKYGKHLAFAIGGKKQVIKKIRYGTKALNTIIKWQWGREALIPTLCVAKIPQIIWLLEVSPELNLRRAKQRHAKCEWTKESLQDEAIAVRDLAEDLVMRYKLTLRTAQ